MIILFRKFKDIIEEYKIIKWDLEPHSSRFIAEILFTDNSTLSIRDYVIENRRKYSYHWQDKENTLLIRWDNAPHWKSISTFPFHKHLGDEVKSSSETTLDEVLETIKQHLNR